MIKFVFCLYDSSYSSNFLKSWISLISFLNKNNTSYLTTEGDSCNAFYAKQMCLGGSVLAGKDQKPFQGRLEYENLVFISGNLNFTSKDFLDLYKLYNNYRLDFISACVEDNYKYLSNYDSNFILADYLDFDMVIIKRGIFEQLDYPWFRPYKSENREQQNFVDIDICNRIKGLNIELLIAKDIILYKNEN